MATALADIFGIAEKFMGIPEWLARAIFGGTYDTASDAIDAFNNRNAPTGGEDTRYGGPDVPRSMSTAPTVIVNFNTPVDSVSAGREVSRVLSDFQRANGRR